MKRSDLHREWARVLDMCEGTKVDPNVCWKFDGVVQECSPSLSVNCEAYTFAVAILEGKPVFHGDRVWSKTLDSYITVTNLAHSINDANSYYSWEEPKRMFVLNGREMPCPVGTGSGALLNPAYYDLVINGRLFHFKSAEDCNRAAQVLTEILTENVK